ncbi:MGMT family protein [Microbispora sp. H11081]|uniref:MGMT family protein n=1 Tax=Microbispora sp. H11081 TaxID=2729107 RepID=UPI00147633FB|nr:MGMT family protein [Microbispora sp. H11081]
MAYADEISPILRAALELLREAGRPLPPQEVREEVARRVTIPPELLGSNAHGQARWWAQLGFRTGEAASLGWMTKRNGWAITEQGVRALDDFEGTELYRELTSQYRARRLPPQGRVYSDPRWNVVLAALERLEPGRWTTYGDLAALVGMSAQSVGGFMAESSDQGGAHRVLQSGGRVSRQFRWADPERTDDPREVLEKEGLAFDHAGRADPRRHVTTDRFRAMLARDGVVLPTSDGPELPPPPDAAPSDAAPAAFEQFQQNIEYARQLVNGGRSLEQLGVGSFDVTDLYRAAWTQAVAALDHWVTREIVDRALSLALNPRVPRPPKFNSLSIPVELFERIHYGDESLGETFRAHLERHFSFMTFQNPDKIKEGFAYVSRVNLWVKVADVLTDQDANNPITADGVRTRLREIAWRRNNIAHTADHDSGRPGQKTPITADQAETTIDWLETMAIAIQLALGDTLPAPDPAGPGETRGAPLPADAAQAAGPRVKRTWDEAGFLDAVQRYCPADVRETLLAVYRHAESHPSFHDYYFGDGEYPSVTAWFNLGSDNASVWSIYTGPVKSVLAVNFGAIRNHGASRERMARLAERLSVLPGSDRLPHQLESAGYAKYPSLQPPALARPESRDVVITALNEFLTGEPPH